MDYRKKIKAIRDFNSISPSDVNIAIESDRGRVIFSPSLRRLQKRTQLFALELNASIRTRLTHSMEVSQNARWLSQKILYRLKQQDKTNQNMHYYGLSELENAFISIAEISSLLHDIGNPPFGHFGEETINEWMKKNAIQMLEHLCNSKDSNYLYLKEQLQRDICNYDGNAQAIRIITKTQRLNLTYTQIISVLKYTRGAFEDKSSLPYSYLTKKPGYYFSEKKEIEIMQKMLHIERYHRFPITYIMEAADDISYLTADIEDACDKGIFTLDELYKIMMTKCTTMQKDCQDKSIFTFIKNILTKEFNKVQMEEEPYRFNMFFTNFRISMSKKLIEYAVEKYMENHQAIFNGSYDKPLLDTRVNICDNECIAAIKVLESVSHEYIYQCKDVQKLELQGYTILNGLLNTYKPLLELSIKDFKDLLNNKKIDDFISNRLIKRISTKQISAYKAEVEAIKSNGKDEKNLLELYYRIRLITDYVSGMTDDFALQEYQTLKVVNHF